MAITSSVSCTIPDIEQRGLPMRYPPTLEYKPTERVPPMPAPFYTRTATGISHTHATTKPLQNVLVLLGSLLLVPHVHHGAVCLRPLRPEPAGLPREIRGFGHPHLRPFAVVILVIVIVIRNVVARKHDGRGDDGTGRQRQIALVHPDFEDIFPQPMNGIRISAARVDAVTQSLPSLSSTIHRERNHHTQSHISFFFSNSITAAVATNCAPLDSSK